METDIKNIPYIVECERCSEKKKVDRLLKMDADMYTNMGIDTSASERKLIKGNSRKIYYAIKGKFNIISGMLFYCSNGF